MKSALYLSFATIALMSTAMARAQAVKEEYLEFEQREYVPPQLGDALGGGVDAAAGANGSVVKGFQGISQYDTAAFTRNFIPPDTMGAVGKTQFVQFANGGFGVFDKTTGARTIKSDLDFWSAAGQTGSQGDSRVMYNAAAQRWVALSFGDDVADIQIAVSKTSDALGAWESTKFTGYAGGTADYPTLAMDKNAVYIGTNDFKGDGSFGGTTLNVIPLSSLLSASAPTTAGIKQFATPYTGGANDDYTRGYAIQGVNSTDNNSSTGHVLAVSLVSADLVRYNIDNAGTSGATRTDSVFLGTAGYDANGAGRQPNAVPDVNPNAPTSPNYFPDNNRVVDTLDDRVGAAVFEANGRIYSVHTVTPTGTDYTVVRYDVVDAATNKILDEGDIGDGKHDFYQGSIAVNELGQVVIGYNRSGSASDGKITFLARHFSTDPSGHLTQRGTEDVLKVSLVDDYHNGSTDGFVASGRQRWGDYSAVSLDPEDSRSFWLIGEYAREYNDAAGGHPGGTGGSRWSTWISQLNVGTTVPEPASWELMIAGFGLVGVMRRRGRTTVLA